MTRSSNDWLAYLFSKRHEPPNPRIQWLTEPYLVYNSTRDSGASLCSYHRGMLVCLSMFDSSDPCYGKSR